VAENTEENANSKFSIQESKPSADDDVESAKILFQEGLFDEAKKLLHQVLIRNPRFSRATVLLEEIRKEELNLIINRSSTLRGGKKPPEDPEAIIRKLEKDLGMDSEFDERQLDPAVENWSHEHRETPEQAFDLGVAFFEMGCYRDAIIELEEALRSIRIARTELGELGVAVASLYAESLIELKEAFLAKSFLLPVLNELELNHEAKIPLFYLVGRADELLGNIPESKSWYKKVLEADPFFRDANFRIRVL
jgi:tetratricopeptide (TPR) repeat protein